jgi:hypothetical protein
MAASSAVVEPVWERYPLIASNSYARRWIQSCVMLGLARNTIAAYMYASGGATRPTVEELALICRRPRLSEYRCQLGDGVIELFSLNGEIWKESSLRQHNGLGYWAAVSLGPVLNACQPVCGSFR